MSLTKEEVKELARILRERGAFPEAEAPGKVVGKRRPPKKAATEFADNVESVREGWSIRDLERASDNNGPGQVIDITSRLPPRRGLLNQRKTMRNLNELLGRYGRGSGATDVEKHIIYSVVSAHMEKDVMTSAREDARDLERHHRINRAWQGVWARLPEHLRTPRGGGSK